MLSSALLFQDPFNLKMPMLDVGCFLANNLHPKHHPVTSDEKNQKNERTTWVSWSTKS